MVIQGLLDIISQWIAGILGLIPPLPADWDGMLDTITDGGNWVGSVLSPLGAIMPYTSMTTVVQWFLGALTFWLAMSVLRLALWVLGR